MMEMSKAELCLLSVDDACVSFDNYRFKISVRFLHPVEILPHEEKMFFYINQSLNQTFPDKFRMT